MRGSDIFWLVWFVVAVGVFLAKETYSLIKGDGGTLSEAIWRLERFRTGQPLGQWTVGHFWFTALFFGMCMWLLFHFSLGWWRS